MDQFSQIITLKLLYTDSLLVLFKKYIIIPVDYIFFILVL